MEPQTITICVSPEAAKIYNSAAAEMETRWKRFAEMR